MLVTVHSFLLLDSRCAECYGKAGEAIQRNSCCDGNNTSSCPASCDILLGFCRLSDLLQFNLTTGNRLSGVECTQTRSSSYAADLLGNDLEPYETHQFSETGSLGGLHRSLSNPVTYYEEGNWVSSVISHQN